MTVKKSVKIEDVKIEKNDCGCSVCCSKWMTAGWVLLLIGGLAHMMPTQMAPILHWALWGVTLQTVVGALSVILALYFLLEE
jgi:hypothetical protein